MILDKCCCGISDQGCDFRVKDKKTKFLLLLQYISIVETLSKFSCIFSNQDDRQVVFFA